MAGSRCINLEPAIIFSPFSSIPQYTFPMKTRAKSYTFPKKSLILTHKPPFFAKAIFIANRKGLLKDWKTLMTDNDLDLNDLNDLIP